ncbi:hypothetical protein Avbf_03667, partial [Armadillidium vulgare]
MRLQIFYGDYSQHYNELRSKSLSDEDCDDENCENITSSSPTPSSDSRSRSSFPRRSFHHSRDQNRFPHNHPPSRHSSSIHQNHHFDQNEVFLERGVSAERCPSKSFTRPFYQENRTHFPPGQKRRQYKQFGSKGGFYTKGYSPYSGEQGPRRRWSEDESLALEDPKEEETDDVEEDDEKPSQPVHTVFIDNEEYTKIQTPRQEVIFKKSSLDKKRDSIDLESSPSSCGSLTGCDPSSQGDQVSLAGSVEEPVLSLGDEPQCDEMQENRPFEDANNLFTGDPGLPPLAGVVMQQAYPGGPMISIPVHWTQFLDPGLIPGDTALTPLDPTFTHIIDPKDLPVNPAHILPVQHDSNGCPVTVQVRVNADGQPVEIEPSAFTVSLSTLEPHQQEIILGKRTDILTSSPNSYSEAPAPLSEKEQLEVKKFDNGNYCSSEEHDDTPKETNSGNKDSDGTIPEQNYDCSPDSQYATMSEASTAPTTPSGELSDITDSAARSKSNPDESALNSYTESSNKLSRLDSLLETEPSEDDYCEDVDSFNFKKTKEVALTDSDCSQESKIDSTDGNVESLQPIPDTISETLLASQPSSIEKVSSAVSETVLSNQSSSTDIVSDQISNQKLSNEIDSAKLSFGKVDKTCLESTSREDSTSQNKKKKNRCNSIDSTISSQTSSVGDIHRSESESVEAPSKYKVKKNARKLKKEKKRLSKEKNKTKISSSANLRSESCTETESSNSKSSSKTSENTPEKDNDTSENTPEKDNITILSENTPEKDNDTSENTPEKDNDTSENTPEKNNDTLENTPEKDNDTLENTPEEDNDLKSSLSEVNVSEQIENSCTDNIDNTGVTNDSENNELNKEHSDSPGTTTDPNSDSPLTKSEKEIAVIENDKVETGKDSQSLSTEEQDENYVCKQGFVMVPILTPYYDPSVLYGYQVIVPENLPERNYNANTNNNNNSNNRKKKKKHRKRYHEDNYLDTELYAGEPFVATPNGYVVPMDASHLCQLHGYQYLPSVFPHIMSDEGFVSIDHPSYMHEHYRDMSHRRLNSYGERERRNRYSKHYEEYRKKTGTGTQNPQEKSSLPKDPLESADSGVSESEELAHLNLTKSANEVDKEINDDKEVSSKKSKGRKLSSNFGNEIEQKQSLENGKSKNSKKKNKNKKKKKKDIVEILEPDFSSFDSPTPRFEVSKNDEPFKPKQNKNSKNKKKKITTNATEDVKKEENDSTSSNKSKKSKTVLKDSTAKNSDEKIASPIPSPSENIVKKDPKVNPKNKKVGKAKNKNKSQKSEKRKSQTLGEKEELCFAEVSNQSESLLNSSLSQNDGITSAQVPEIPQTEESPLHETSEFQTEENFACVNSTNDQDFLSQESGIGVESEESLNYNESYDASILSQEEEEELKANEQDETSRQSDESKNFPELGNENYVETFDDEVKLENIVTCSGNETTSENVVTCSGNEPISMNVVTCSDNEPILDDVLTCSENETILDNVLTCSDNETILDNVLSDNETTSENCVTCSEMKTISENVITCPCNETISENVTTCYDNEMSMENLVTYSENEKTIENVITCAIESKELVTEKWENSQKIEVENSDIYIEDTFSTSELDSESLQLNCSSLSTPEDILSHSENFVKEESNICNIKLESKCDNFAINTNNELASSSSENSNQVVSFKDLGVTEAVKRWIREVTPEKAFCITDETRSIIFAKSKEYSEI